MTSTEDMIKDIRRIAKSDNPILSIVSDMILEIQSLRERVSTLERRFERGLPN